MTVHKFDRTDTENPTLKCLQEFINTEKTLSHNCSVLSEALNKTVNMLSDKNDKALCKQLIHMLNTIREGYVIWMGGKHTPPLIDGNGQIQLLKGHNGEVSESKTISRMLETLNDTYVHKMSCDQGSDYFASIVMCCLYHPKLNALFDNNKKFREITDKKMRRIDKTVNVGPQSVLINPIQRIPRLELLVKEFLKLVNRQWITSEDNQEIDEPEQKTAVENAESLVRKTLRVAGTLNEHMGKSENIEKSEFNIVTYNELLEEIKAKLADGMKQSHVLTNVKAFAMEPLPTEEKAAELMAPSKELENKACDNLNRSQIMQSNEEPSSSVAASSNASNRVLQPKPVTIETIPAVRRPVKNTREQTLRSSASSSAAASGGAFRKESHATPVSEPATQASESVVESKDSNASQDTYINYAEVSVANAAELFKNLLRDDEQQKKIKNDERTRNTGILKTHMEDPNGIGNLEFNNEASNCAVQKIKADLAGEVLNSQANAEVFHISRNDSEMPMPTEEETAAVMAQSKVLENDAKETLTQSLAMQSKEEILSDNAASSDDSDQAQSSSSSKSGAASSENAASSKDSGQATNSTNKIAAPDLGADIEEINPPPSRNVNHHYRHRNRFHFFAVSVNDGIDQRHLNFITDLEHSDLTGDALKTEILNQIRDLWNENRVSIEDIRNSAEYEILKTRQDPLSWLMNSDTTSQLELEDMIEGLRPQG